jgi:hypothetical protein
MRRSLLSVVAGLAVALAAVPASATPTAGVPTFLGPFAPQGGFEVQALADGVWQHVGDLSFDRFVRERTIRLPEGAFHLAIVRIRLVEHGGGAAHIDEIRLGDCPPARLAGAAEPDAAALASVRDNDLVDAFGRLLEVDFPTPPSPAVLRVSARVEGPVVEGSPFAFPPADLLQPMTPESAFYTFVPSPGRTRPFWPQALDPSSALFAERCAPTTGHPDGVTYGWVSNDATTLYAAVEFTSDNTCDGDKDWSAVWVERKGRLKEFRVSTSLTRWGRPSFVATARAGYRHKLYTFAIPFHELGADTASQVGPLKLAFAAYGTAAFSLILPAYWDFGTIAVGSTSPAASFTINNPSPTLSMTLATPWITRSGPDSAVFSLAPGGCSDGLVIAPLGNCTFQMAFAPTAVGARTDNLLATATIGTGSPVTGPLQVVGQGIEAIPILNLLGLPALVLMLFGVGFLALRRS